jgi:NADPH:quinone reductase-like Zn-dependent oxidoreductase/3-oxoacyl-(acyl-carrier-protein) synthase
MVMWSSLEVTDCARTQVFAISNVEKSHEALVAKPFMGAQAIVVVANVAMQRGPLTATPLVALEVTLALVQIQINSMLTPILWMLMPSSLRSPSHAGSWGLSRSARSEATLPHVCLQAPFSMALTKGPALSEPEAVLHVRESCVPRLKTASPFLDSAVRLHFNVRGAMSNLFIEPLPSLPPLGDTEVLIRVRAVGLNFRDVLNVLGEYPGDPGPPGGDMAGVVGEASPTTNSTFGLAHAPLACLAIAATAFLASKPTTLSFEQTCTLPVTWSTAHTSVQRAGLRPGSLIIIQAAAGGVGLKVVDYAHWLNASLLGTAGRPHKHAQLRTTGVYALSSSRDSMALAMGVTRHLEATRSHAVLNSLSLDFIAASRGSLGEGGAFMEIGKRGIWALDLHKASGPTVAYCAIALDADMAFAPTWMCAVLTLLASRASTGSLTSLPLRSFNMVLQHELAFRTLKSGLNTGKIVVRIAEFMTGRDGVHVVTGGSSGLGFITGRWLAQRGARYVVLASRSGLFAKDTDVEREAMQAKGVTPALERCDTSETAHIARLMSMAPSSGVWHAAGTLADATLPKQVAASLPHVCSPKANGAWSLHATSVASSVQTFALFSSVTALLGGAGQANYAAGNACLDALATYRHACGSAAASVQWGPWAEVGIAARGVANARVAEMEMASGISRIGLALGVKALGMAVQHTSPPVLAVAPIAWSWFLREAVPAFLTLFAPKAMRVGTAGSKGVQVADGFSLETVLGMVKLTAGGSVEADAPLMDAGVDSLGAVELRNQLQRVAGGQTLPSTFVFDHPTARQLELVFRRELITSTGDNAAPVIISVVPMGGGEGIAGLSTLLPRGASSLLSATYAVLCGHNAVIQVPTARWDVSVQPPFSETASRVRHASFVRGAELVDNAVFAVSPAEVAAMDPCQRLVLEFGYAALSDASINRASLDGSLTGVFLGFANIDFSHILTTSPAGGSVFAATGSSASIAAGRLSFTLGLHGPCVTYDTACSASLVASHSGRRALQLAECTVGLAVSVALSLAPSIGMSFAAAGMTSARGRSHTFDTRADGYARGEACGGVALRSGVDNGVVMGLLGSAVRQDGRSVSLTAPNGLAQQRLLVAALQDASTCVEALAFNEAHGTGTALGDPIEAGSLAAAVLLARGEARGEERGEALGLGGVKASIGHAESAAGMTGLLKLALELQAAEIWPNAQLRVLNPYVDDALRGGACGLSAQVAAVTDGRASVSSFGYSGTLAHAVLSRARGEAAFPTSVSPHTFRRSAFLWRHFSSHDAHLCIVGAGTIGLIVARDAASCEISSVVLEREPVIGGVWAKNDYPGLRLQVSGASYRCFSLAPPWTREGEGKGDVCYCPTGREVLVYLLEMAAHELISVRTSTSYISHTGSGGSFTVSTSRGSISVRALVFAPGAHETTAGSPHWPIDPSKVTNGACILHSSGLAASHGRFYSAKRKFVVGSSKAAIDVLKTLDPEDANVIWAHRGHIIFHNRDRIHAALMEGEEAQPEVMDQARIGNLFLKNQEFAAAFDGMLRSGAGICVGQPLAAQPAMRGGAESEASLAHARKFLPCQIIITSLRCNDGMLQICCEDGHVLSVETDDAAVLCTGQRAKDAGEGSYARRAEYNQGGLFHVAPFSNQTPINGLYLLNCVMTYLNGIPSAYNDGRLAEAFTRQAQRMETIKDRGAWARFWANMGGVEYDIAHLIFDPSKYKATGLETHHRWCGEWYGNDVQVEHAFRLLATESAESSARSDASGGAIKFQETDISETALLFKVLDALRDLGAPDLGGGMADTQITSAGLDSRGAIELRSSIQEVVGGMELPVALVFDYPTPRAIATLVSSELQIAVLPEVIHAPVQRSGSGRHVGWVRSARLAAILGDDIFATIWYTISVAWLQALHMYSGHASLQTSFAHDASRRWRWRVKYGSQLPSLDSRSERLVFTDRATPVFYDTATEQLWLNHTVWDGVSLVMTLGDRPTQHLSIYDEHVSQMHVEWEDGDVLVDRVLCGPALFDASPTFRFERRREYLPKDVFQKIARYAARTTISQEIAWYAVLMVVALECAHKASATVWVQDANRHTTNADVFGYCTSEVGYIVEADVDTPFEQRVRRCVEMMMGASAEYRSVFPEIAATHTRTGEFFERALGLNYVGNGDNVDSTNRSVIAASLAAERGGTVADGELAFFGNMNWIEVGGETNPLVQLSGRADTVDFMAHRLLPALSHISLDIQPKSVELAQAEMALHTPAYLLAATRRSQDALDLVLSASVPPRSLPEQTEFAIVGAGLAGLTIAATVSVASVSYAIFERMHSAGGQWRSNAK